MNAAESNIQNLKHLRGKNSSLKKFFFFFLVGLFILGIGLIITFINSPGKVFDYAFKVSSVLGRAPFKSNDGRVNILLLGNGGGKHEGADLTDSIMIASYNIKDKKATFISIPRDLWLDENRGKINTVYEKGKDKGQGLKYSEQMIGKLVGLPIHYTVRIDFGGFVKAVDEVGGIDVDVARVLDDYIYPLTGKEDDLCGYSEIEKDFSADEAKTLNIEPGKRKVLIAPDGKIATDSAEEDKGIQYFSCRYEHIHFDKGINHMDGENALKFVRSRHGLGAEGSDFARSARQQKVIEAFREKVLSLDTLTNPKKISGLLDAYGESFETDIPIDDMVALYGLTKNMENSQNIVLSNGGEKPLLYNPPLSEYGGAWVLAPKDRSLKEIQSYIMEVLEGSEVKGESSGSAWAR